MKNNSKTAGASPKVPLHPAYKKSGLRKYDCPNPDCSAWFVTFDPLDVLCKDCRETMLDTEVM